MEKRYCSNCGHQLTGKEKFCPRCGNAVEAMWTEIKYKGKKNEAGSILTDDRKHKKGKNPIIVALCLIMILFAGSIGTFLFLKSLDEYEYLAVVANEEGLYGCINEHDKEIIECKYDLVTINEDNVIVWKEKDGTGESTEYDKGVLSTAGEIIIPVQYAEVESLNVDGETVFAIAEQAGIDEEGEPILNWGFADEQGEMITDFKYQYGELAKLSIGYDETQGIIPVSCYVEYDSDEGYIYGAINNKGEEIIPLDSQFISPLQSVGNSGLLAIERKSGGEWKTGFVNYSNETVLPFEYDDARNFMDNGLAAVKKNDKWGYIDQAGTLVVPYRYDSAYDFAKNGLAEVKSGDMTIYINENGDELIKGEWSTAFEFDENGFAQVFVEGQAGLINEKGEEIFPCSYNDIYFQNGMYIAQGSTYYSVMDAEGQTVYNELEDVINRNYDSLWGMGDNDWVCVGKILENGKEHVEYECTYLDKKGNVRLMLSTKYIYASPFEHIERKDN